MTEVQQVLNHLPSITVPKQLITAPRKQRKSRARLGSTVYLKDTTYAGSTVVAWRRVCSGD